MNATRPGAASPTPSDDAHDPAAMCRYPSKKCFHRRAVKRNGELHNLCDFHRQKANKNQRRLELKRKARAQADDAQGGKRCRVKKPRVRARRAPLSAALAMQEEMRIKREAAPLAASFLQDLALMDGKPLELELPLPIPPQLEKESLERILLDGPSDVRELATSLEQFSKTEQTSPVDVGDDVLDFSDFWLLPEQPAMSFDASTFAVDEDVFIADV